jgi:hypothetical protein
MPDGDVTEWIDVHADTCREQSRQRSFERWT